MLLLFSIVINKSCKDVNIWSEDDEFNLQIGVLL